MVDAEHAGYPAPDAAPEAEAESGRGERSFGASSELPPEVNRIAAAAACLDDLDELPVGDHVARFDAVHSELQDALASIDEV